MSNNTSPKNKGLLSMFALITVAALAVPYTALGAGRAVGNSGAVGVSRPSRQQTFSHGFRHSRFFGGEGIGGAEVTIEQSQSTPTVQPKPANRRYVQPRWVDGGYGVEVLEPGYWIDTGKE
jgi:F0F1-type ATP synthase membrane subunit c/vacuolar-type H+-ATPase subunit K